MRSSEVAAAGWRNGEGDQTNCVEIAELPDRTAIRDSKDPTGPVLALTHRQWRAFLDCIQTEQFD